MSNNTMTRFNITQYQNPRDSVENITTEYCSDDDISCWRELILDYIYPKTYQWIFVVLFGVVFLLGLAGNFLVCYSVWKSRNLQTVTNYLLVNLAVADFMVILICLPPSVAHDITQSWFLGLAMCKLVVYLQKVSVFVSELTLTAISIERYLAICHPLTFRGSKFKTRLALVIIWVISLLTPTPDFFTMTLVMDDVIPQELSPLLTGCRPADHRIEGRYQWFMLVVFYLVPLCIMTFTYSKIAYCLWFSTNSYSNTEDLQTESAIRQLKARRRTAKMLIVVVVAFTVCYLPVYLINICRYHDLMQSISADYTDIILAISLTSHWLCYFNSAINPVIYNFMSGKFRKEFVMTLHGCCGRAKKATEEVSSRSGGYSKTKIIRMTDLRNSGRTMVTVNRIGSVEKAPSV